MSRRAPRCAGAALLLVLPALAGGCRNHAGTSPLTLERIPGIEAVEVDALSVVVTAEGDGLTLFSPTGPVDRLPLAVGDAFLLSDGSSMTDTYTLLRADPGEVLFRRETRVDRSASGEAMRETVTVVRVEPYRPKRDQSRERERAIRSEPE